MDPKVTSLKQFAEIMETQRWTFAVNYAKYCPHYYTTERAWLSSSPDWQQDLLLAPVTIQDCGRFIEEQGEPMAWGRKKTIRMYVTVNNWRYWQMDPHWSQCDLINRQELKLSTCKPVPPPPPTPPIQFNLL